MMAAYRIITWLRHQLTAWNTTGEGIHSPYLFYLVRFLFAETYPYYIFTSIEQRREAMSRAPKRLQVVDYGPQGHGQTYDKLVSNIARRELEQPRIAQLFFRLLVHLSHEAKRPLQVVELGTSLGITTAYLAAAHSRNQITTFEGSEELVKMAQLNTDKLGLKNIQFIEGNIDETIECQLPENVDFAFIDANHSEAATMRYFEALARRANEKTILVLDDLYHSPEMTRAWRQIQHDKRVTTTIDAYRVGLVFFDPHYMPRNYRVRI